MFDDVLFEWDEKKNLSNQRKHGVDFAIAVRVFADPQIEVEFNQIDQQTGEERWQAKGLVEGRLLLLVIQVYRRYQMSHEKSYESFQPGQSAPAQDEADIRSFQEERIVRIRRDEVFERPLSAEQLAQLDALQQKANLEDEDEIDLANFRPARDFEQFRRWQDYFYPEAVPAFEEARRRWHERNDPK